MISIDSKGTDVRVRQGAQVISMCCFKSFVFITHPSNFSLSLYFLQFNVQRISFEEGHSVETLEEAKAALWKLINGGRLHNLQK